jgi:hypothetical protein
MNLQWLSQGPGGVHASCANCQGTVCVWCWGVPDFEQCKLECEQQFAGDQAAISRCVCQSCVNDAHCGGVGTRDPTAYGWMVKSQDTCEHQDEVNRVLVANGYAPIARDCVLGPLTCGASRTATDIDSSVGIPSPCFQHQSEWKFPTKGQPAPLPVVTKKKSRAGLIAGLAALTIGGLVIYAQGG